ncbi:putative non-specific serine/threonine protein kinase [Helianthus anomalus]
MCILHVLIDFGLSFVSTLPEDKAVDLYVVSMHSSCWNVVSQMEILLHDYDLLII